MSHTTHHDGCECFQIKMKELEAKLAKARDALDHINDTLAWDCCSEAIGDEGLHVHYEELARQALKEIDNG